MDFTLKYRKTGYNRRLAKKRFQWLIEALCFVSSTLLAGSLVLRKPLLRQAPNRYEPFLSMKNTVFIFVSALLILSCQSTSIEQNIEDPEIDVNKTNGKENDSMKQIMASRLEGFWMSKSYLDNVKRTKSPFKAKDYSASWFAFELQKKNLLSDDPKLFGMQSNEGGYYAKLEWNSEDGYICANKNSFA